MKSVVRDKLQNNEVQMKIKRTVGISEYASKVDEKLVYMLKML